MKTINVSKAEGSTLDWLVAKCEGGYDLRCVSTYSDETAWQYTVQDEEEPDRQDRYYLNNTAYSTDWSLSGSIIEREKITVVCCEGDYNPIKSGTSDSFDTYWVAEMGRQPAMEVYGSQGDNWGACFQIDVDAMQGPTPLIAAMRCYVSSRLGDTVEVPEELS